MNEPLSPERIFVSSMSFDEFFISNNCYIAKSLNVINGKMFQLVIDENQMVVTQRMTLIDFFVGALCMTFILKLNPLFIYMYM